jgi:hypothetical protein
MPGAPTTARAYNVRASSPHCDAAACGTSDRHIARSERAGQAVNLAVNLIVSASAFQLVMARTRRAQHLTLASFRWTSCLDMVGVTGSSLWRPPCAALVRLFWTSVEGVADEGQKLAQVAARAPPRQPRRTPQGSCLCHQQDQSPVQGAPGLRQHPPHSRPAGVRALPPW